jgi:hypothetical protein
MGEFPARGKELRLRGAAGGIRVPLFINLIDQLSLKLFNALELDLKKIR